VFIKQYLCVLPEVLPEHSIVFIKQYLCVLPDSSSAGKRASGDVCLEKQLERFEWQLRILREANGNPERAELLREHADKEVCSLVLSLLDKVSSSSPAVCYSMFERRVMTRVVARGPVEGALLQLLDRSVKLINKDVGHFIFVLFMLLLLPCEALHLKNIYIIIVFLKCDYYIIFIFILINIIYIIYFFLIYFLYYISYLNINVYTFFPCGSGVFQVTSL